MWELYQLAEVTDEEGKNIKKAICSLCDGLQLTYTGGMTNLLNHLESEHSIAHKTATGDSDSGTKKRATSLQEEHTNIMHTLCVTHYPT